MTLHVQLEMMRMKHTKQVLICKEQNITCTMETSCLSISDHITLSFFPNRGIQRLHQFCLHFSSSGSLGRLAEILYAQIPFPVDLTLFKLRDLLIISLPILYQHYAVLIFVIELWLIHSIMFVSGVQHGHLTITHITKYSPR